MRLKKTWLNPASVMLLLLLQKMRRSILFKLAAALCDSDLIFVHISSIIVSHAQVGIRYALEICVCRKCKQTHTHTSNFGYRPQHLFDFRSSSLLLLLTHEKTALLSPNRGCCLWWGKTFPGEKKSQLSWVHIVTWKVRGFLFYFLVARVHAETASSCAFPCFFSKHKTNVKHTLWWQSAAAADDAWWTSVKRYFWRANSQG